MALVLSFAPNGDSGTSRFGGNQRSTAPEKQLVSPADPIGA